MGAYVSIPDCRSHYNITVNCNYNVTSDNAKSSNDTIGGYFRGELPTNPDIAGIGVVSSFMATTSFALLLSIISVAWLIGKRCWTRHEHDHTEKKQKQRIRLSEFCEELVLSCSDTQIFTGGAYAWTLRYFTGCSITAYHYDIVANLMLLTCATHLMSITIVRNYWKYPWLGILRTFICTGVFIVTGILLANQNSSGDLTFPGETPSFDKTNSPILMPAACFQQGNSQLLGTLGHSLSDKSQQAFIDSAPGNRIPGWNNYLIILLLYLVAGFVDVLRALRRGAKSKPNGRRARIVNWLTCSSRRKETEKLEGRTVTPFITVGGLIFTLFCAYLLAGVGVSCWTVVQSARYISDLRWWAKRSGWLKLEDGLQSAEDDATSFGQLVPIFLNLLLIMTIAQLMSQSCMRFSHRKYDIYGGVIHEHEHERPPTTLGGSGGASKSNVAVQVQQYYPDMAVSSSPLPSTPGRWDPSAAHHGPTARETPSPPVGASGAGWD
ncbi:hypothetical protein B0H66DRAFT_633087 [Apodospora peruviana]|uniref:Transmembrane protein n=1 Tax=Apodospora peruviana TaxID=516989 RepID=A0AAE0HUT3_9PEZI|nr:hypothetical protein B0H66DRAFT_633087 [Apodospora peruviana]